MARQKVRPAYQLLNASSALALRRYTTKKTEADFFEIIDAGMDVLNAGHPGDVKLLRRGYSGRPEQEAALSALAEEIAAFRVGSAKFLYPFQKGLLVTIRAVRGLLADVQAKFGSDTYILTRRLTQDRLDSFFGRVRGRHGGSNQHGRRKRGGGGDASPQSEKQGDVPPRKKTNFIPFSPAVGTKITKTIYSHRDWNIVGNTETAKFFLLWRKRWIWQRIILPKNGFCRKYHAFTIRHSAFIYILEIHEAQLIQLPADILTSCAQKLV